MKQKLLNRLWLRVGMIAAVMTTALAGTAAAEEDATISIGINPTGSTSSSYIVTDQEFTIDGVTFVMRNYNPSTGQIRGNQSSVSSNFYLYNTTAIPGTLKSVTIEDAAVVSTKTYINTGNDPITTPNAEGTNPSGSTWNNLSGTYFCISMAKGGTSGTVKMKGVTITYTPSGGTVDPSVATSVTIDATGITNTDVYVSTEAGKLSATVVDEDDNTVEDAEITWSGDNDNVATIDATTGVVTLVAAGKVTFTAAYAGAEGEYKASSATYELTVTSSAPYVQPTTVEINMNYQWLGSASGSNLSSDQLPVVNTDDNVTTTITDGTSTRPRGDADYIRLYKGSTITFAAPDGYTITKIEFTTGGNNTWNAPTVDSGTLTEKTWEGEAESVVFTLSSGNCFISKATVTLEAIVPQVLSSITLGGDYPTTFHVGDTFSSEGITVTATYESGKTADVTEEANFSGYDMQTVGQQTVTVSYTEGDIVATATYDITVMGVATLTAITLSGTYPTEFQQGDTFSSEGIVVTASFDDETTSDVTSDAVFSGYDTDVLGEQTVTVSYTSNEVTKTATYGITVVEKRGTAENPYTVAQAIAAIDAGTGVTDVYATGIVSEIVTAYSSQYGNITYNISADGSTTSDQLQAYRGKSYNGDNFTSEDDIQVGDEVVIYGNLTKYGSTYEFAANNQLVSLVRPVVTTPSVTVSPKSISATADGAEGTITVTYNNITDVMAEVFFCDAEGNEATYDWIDAEINSDNNVTYLIGANESTEARTAYLKVYALDDDANDVYSDLITVTQAGYVVDYAEVPFVYNGGLSNLPTGFTQSGLGIYNTSPSLKFDTTGDYLIVKINKEASMLFFDIKGNSFSGGTFTVQTSADGNTYTDLSTYTSLGSSTQTVALELEANVRYIKWVYTQKSSGNVGLGNIKVVDWINEVTVGEAGYATYVTEHNVSFPSGVKAYIGAVNGQYLKLTEVAAAPKGTPVVLKGEGTYTLIPVVADDTADVTGNELKAAEEDVETDGTQYVLAKPDGYDIGFYKASGTIPAGKAYLQVTDDANVKGFTFLFGDDATGIEMVNGGWSTVNDQPIYNLAGQRIQKLQKGISIVGGRKVLVK